MATYNEGDILTIRVISAIDQEPGGVEGLYVSTYLGVPPDDNQLDFSIDSDDVLTNEGQPAVDEPVGIGAVVTVDVYQYVRTSLSSTPWSRVGTGFADAYDWADLLAFGVPVVESDGV